MTESDEYKRYCIVLTNDSTKDIATAKKYLVKQGEDGLTLTNSAIIRKALRWYVLNLKRRMDNE